MSLYSHSPAQQRGMAIISALLIAAVVAVIAGGMITRQSVLTRNLEAAQQRAQGEAVLLGALEWSRQLLQQQRRLDPLTRPGQSWAQPIRALPLGERGPAFEGHLEDEQGKFNLSNLVLDGRVDEVAVQTFQRLGQLLGINSSVSSAIVQRVIGSYALLPEVVDDTPHSGFDSGRLTSPGAASRPTPASRPMLRSVDDLLGAAGVDRVSLERLRTFVTVLPATTWVNGNTASAEVLAAEVPGLSVEKAQGLIAARNSGRWFINRGDFVNRLGLPQVDVASVHVGITSDWFLLSGQASRDGHSLPVQALILRGPEAVPSVIWTRVGA